jgi:hypothetical protein
LQTRYKTTYFNRKSSASRKKKLNRPSATKRREGMLNDLAPKKRKKKNCRNPSREEDKRNHLEDSPKSNLLGNTAQYVVTQFTSRLEIVRLGWRED